jgi:hypothetical protein
LYSVWNDEVVVQSGVHVIKHLTRMDDIQCLMFDYHPGTDLKNVFSTRIRPFMVLTLEK